MHVFFNLTPELVKKNVNSEKTMTFKDVMTIQYNDKQSQVMLPQSFFFVILSL